MVWGQRSSCGVDAPPCHVQCLLDTKHLHQWSGSSEVVEYPMLLLVGRHQHRFKRWFVLYAFMLRLLQLNIPPPQGGNGWASGDHLPGGYSIGQSGNQLYLRPRSLFHSWWQQFLRQSGHPNVNLETSRDCQNP